MLDAMYFYLEERDKKGQRIKEKEGRKGEKNKEGT
jgi:hypothetical protein